MRYMRLLTSVRQLEPACLEEVTGGVFDMIWRDARDSDGNVVITEAVLHVRLLPAPLPGPLLFGRWLLLVFLSVFLLVFLSVSRVQLSGEQHHERWQTEYPRAAPGQTFLYAAGGSTRTRTHYIENLERTYVQQSILPRAGAVSNRMLAAHAHVHFRQGRFA